MHKFSDLKIYVFCVIVVGVNIAYGFNLSPKPNVVVQEPTLNTFNAKERSSYFGYTISLRTNR